MFGDLRGFFTDIQMVLSFPWNFIINQFGNKAKQFMILDIAEIRNHFSRIRLINGAKKQILYIYIYIYVFSVCWCTKGGRTVIRRVVLIIFIRIGASPLIHWTLLSKSKISLYEITRKRLWYLHVKKGKNIKITLFTFIFTS